MLLLELQRWAVSHSDLRVSTVLLDGGPLVAAFEALGPVLQPEELAGAGADLVYLNTVGSAPCLAWVPSETSVVCHVHELDFALTNWITEGDRQALRDRVDRFIVVSDMVGDALRRCVGIDDRRIVRHYGFIDVDAVEQAGRVVGHDRVGWVVGASGTTEWRKGPDLFLALADEVHRRRPDVSFRWVGGSASGPDIDGVLADRARAGLDDTVEYLGEQQDAPAWFAGFDVFVLMSRDDPFPRTVLEAAALRVPVVSFDSTGAREFLADGCGVVVEYPDVDAMAEAVVALLDEPGSRQALAEAAHRRVLADHDLAVAAPRMLAELEAVLTS